MPTVGVMSRYIVYVESNFKFAGTEAEAFSVTGGLATNSSIANTLEKSYMINLADPTVKSAIVVAKRGGFYVRLQI